MFLAAATRGNSHLPSTHRYQLVELGLEMLATHGQGI